VSIGRLATEADLERFVEGLLMQRLTSQQGQLGSAQEALAEVPRIVRGEVAGNATITRGSGFSVGIVGTGDRSVTFDTPFPATPVVVVGMGPATINAQVQIHVSGPPSTTGFRVAIMNAAGTAAADQPFTFVAVAV
jgi:hypothetical protein